MDQDYIQRATLGFRRCRSTSGSTTRSAWPRSPGSPRTTIVGLRAPLRGDARRVPPGGHRALAPRQRRHDVPDHRVPARADRRLRAPARRGAPGVERRVRAPDAVIERPDLMPQPAPRIDQHDPARARAHRSGPGRRRSRRSTSTTRTRPRSAQPGAWCWRARARGPLHGRARAAPHRHDRLRRSRAPGDHVHGAHRLLQVLRPPLPSSSPAGDRAGGEARSNWAVFRLLRPRHGAARPHFSKSADRSHHAHRSASGDPVDRGHHPRAAPGGALGAARACGRPYLPFADGAPTPSGKVEFLLGDAGPGGPARAAHLPSRSSRARSTRAHARAIRCSASCRPTASSSTRRSASPSCCGAASAGPRCSSIRPTPPPAASGPATRCWCASARGEARFTAELPTTRARGWRWWRGSGGTSTSRAGAGSTRSPTIASRTWAAGRRCTPTWCRWSAWIESGDPRVRRRDRRGPRPPRLPALEREYWAAGRVPVHPEVPAAGRGGALLDDVRRLEPGLNRNYIPRHKKGGSVSHYAIADEGPALLAFYRSSGSAAS